MRRAPVALAIAALVLAGCVSHVGVERPRVMEIGGFGPCPSYPTVNLTVRVDGAPSPLASVELLTETGYRVMLSCMGPSSMERVPATAPGEAAGVVERQHYSEVRVVLADGAVRLATGFRLDGDATLALDLTAGNESATLDGRGLLVRGVERAPDAHGLERVRAWTGKVPLVDGTRNLTLTVNSSWNRGAHVYWSLERSHDYDDERAEMERTRGALVRVTLVDPDGITVRSGEIRDWYDGEDFDTGALRAGTWTLVVETRTAHEPHPGHRFEVLASVDY